MNIPSTNTSFTKNFGEALINVRLGAMQPSRPFGHVICFQFHPKQLIVVRQLQSLLLLVHALQEDNAKRLHVNQLFSLDRSLPETLEENPLFCQLFDDVLIQMYQ